MHSFLHPQPDDTTCGIAHGAYGLREGLEQVSRDWQGLRTSPAADLSLCDLRMMVARSSSPQNSRGKRRVRLLFAHDP